MKQSDKAFWPAGGLLIWNSYSVQESHNSWTMTQKLAIFITDSSVSYFTDYLLYKIPESSSFDLSNKTAQTQRG